MHHTHRKQSIQRINQENGKLLNRLSTVKPRVLTTREWQQHADVTEDRQYRMAYFQEGNRKYSIEPGNVCSQTRLQTENPTIDTTLIQARPSTAQNNSSTRGRNMKAKRRTISYWNNPDLKSMTRMPESPFKQKQINLVLSPKLFKETPSAMTRPSTTTGLSFSNLGEQRRYLPMSLPQSPH